MNSAVSSSHMHQPGQKLRDARGREYFVDANGSLRTMIFAKQEDGEPIIMLARKWSKARRKAEKRKKHARASHHPIVT